MTATTELGSRGRAPSGAGAGASDGKGDQFALCLEGCRILTGRGGGGALGVQISGRHSERGSAYREAGWVKPLG